MALVAALVQPSVAAETSTESLAEYLVAHHRTPEDYVVALFKDHDVVYLGESHGVKQNLLFLQRLIPKLHAAGVDGLACEMAFTVEQAEIDRLLAALVYDDRKALMLLFHWDPQNGWAFQEYADVLRAAWQVDRSLPTGAPRFRVVGIDYRPDWILVKPGDAITDRLTRWKAWAGSNQITRNVTMADVILREFVDKGRKVLVYGGYGHTPLVPALDEREETGMRFSAAYLVRRRIGDRITTVRVRPYGTGFAALDAVIAALPARHRAVGFDLEGSPLGELPLPEELANRLVTDKKKVTLADEVNGMVHLNEPEDPVTLAPGFLTEALVEQAKREGWLPNVPAVNLDWVEKNAERILKPAVSGR